MRTNNKIYKSFRIPILIVISILIFGVWYIKNNDSKDETSSNLASGDYTLEVDSINLDILKSYNIPIIIDFGATECVPCKEMAPVLKKLNNELENKAFIKFVDVWKHNDVATDFPVQIIPTQIIIDSDGNPYKPTKDIGVELVTYTYKETNEIAFTTHQGPLTEEQLKEILLDMGVKYE